ncbi:3-dehydroquinate dehydratase [Sporobacter termitidis DSM 10068]|uniref:3-dehydroquinate dehydratase n=1 Tax=Sporobacter termitidis DSM 10068 TaxID=1123282 RepID=A0A1M5X3H8_9FIRM|nr:type II 3-dehydroquinate dehydratase [Sporobacter termitidis]SHH93753.1 3-dehydroquinate dehydratase [Sporobacter termitidis DSM 10068]
MILLVINGPNINMLGLREPGIYGKRTYNDLLDFLRAAAKESGVELELFQSNSEGAIVDIIQWAYGKIDGIVLNPAAYTHTSIAILDALKAVSIPAVEVHLSDPNTREEFRHKSFVREACVKTIAGKGFDGYKEAMLFLKDYITEAAL